jgi:hypothetical protein
MKKLTSGYTTEDLQLIEKFLAANLEILQHQTARQKGWQQVTQRDDDLPHLGAL